MHPTPSDALQTTHHSVKCKMPSNNNNLLTVLCDERDFFQIKFIIILCIGLSDFFLDITFWTVLSDKWWRYVPIDKDATVDVKELTSLSLSLSFSLFCLFKNNKERKKEKLCIKCKRG